MKLFNMFKKEKKEEIKQSRSEGQRKAAGVAIAGHRSRIANLQEEFDRLTAKLENIDLSVESTKNEKVKQTDIIIRRMSLLKYEIDIREGLIRWLS